LPTVFSQNQAKKLTSAHSPYLAGLLAREAPLESMDAILDAARAVLKKRAEIDDVMRVLRLAKRRVALLVALNDLSGTWDDMTVTAELSRFADFAVGAALAALLDHAGMTEKNCGLSVIALGKWGAHELNYSSDIDLMFIYDPSRSKIRDADGLQNFYVRITRELARMMEEHTADGYVFRTDLRLRPDPGSMPLAVSIDTAEAYYGSLGQNWERAAMIKARPVAGDPAIGRDFMALMTAWIWRRNLDFATIQDIHSIKRQINAKQKNPRRSAHPLAGVNVKLGHGGIREIEFFAQTQQLIYGGKNPALRTPQTLAALAALEQAGHITARARKDMTEAYLFLRRVEHRLQMHDDRQTHSLPEKAPELNNIARFCGFSTTRAFEKHLQKHMQTVQKHYTGLFIESQSLSPAGNLVFTGVEDDPETLVTLSAMGFSAPEKVTAAVRGWHHGRYRAVRSERARQILTEITPHLLTTLGATAHPDDAFMRFDRFLEHQPSGIPIFSMFARNPKMLELVADVMGVSPAMAEYLGTHPNVLEGVLSRDFFGRLPDIEWLRQDLAHMLAAARDYQDVLDITRRWAREKRFHAGIHLLKQLSPQEKCAACLSDIAEAAINGIMPHVETDFARQHGRFKTGGLVLLAMGSFAARRMFADSDLDLVALYHPPKGGKESKGAKPLPPSHYYIRLMQRIVSALSAPTAEGILYDIDTRLRPAGTDGPLAADIGGFIEYQKNNAWTWEHMSLSRARVIYGDGGTLEKDIRTVILTPRDTVKLKRDITDMRRKIEQQFGSKNKWDLKNRRGGMTDILFAVQCLNLSQTKFMPPPDTATALDKLLKAGKIGTGDYKKLRAAYDSMTAVQSFLRLAAEMPYDPKKAATGVNMAVAKIMKKKKIGDAAKQLDKLSADAYAIYKKITKI
jgi:glutamate-ammonia-ligase adenylyltransferase